MKKSHFINDELIFNIFLANKDKCLDLFGKQIRKGKIVSTSKGASRIYLNYKALVQDVLKAYKPEIIANGRSYYIVPCNPDELSPEEQTDITEMLEAIIEIIHYAKHKRSKK